MHVDCFQQSHQLEFRFLSPLYACGGKLVLNSTSLVTEVDSLFLKSPLHCPRVSSKTARGRRYKTYVKIQELGNALHTRTKYLGAADTKHMLKSKN